MAERARRQGPLRALFIGRLDPQKGIERLRDIVALTPGLTWRAAGRAVLDRAPEPIPGLEIEPPVDAAGLDALLAWADVLVLPSRFEGSPLTIPEAQRLGCVPLVTGTGAVAEMITDGVDGFVIPARPSGRDDPAVVTAFAARLSALDADRARLRALAAAAAARAAALPGWGVRMAPLIDRLDQNKVSAP
jgi:glycosyltransferase involved in cell wall biosynthesis